MKLAFCIFKYYPFGGLERDFYRIAKACQERGHQIIVYTMRWQGDNAAEFALRLLPKKGLSNHQQCLNFAKVLPQFLAKDNPDVVIGFNRMPHLDVYFAGDLCYQKSSRARHGNWYRLLPRYRAYAALEKAVFNSDAHTEILLLTQQAKADFIHYYHTPEERFHLIPPGVGSDRQLPANALQIRQQLREELNIKPDQLLILMVGSDFKRKGVDRAIRAIAALPITMHNQVKLIVIGKGNSAPLLRLAQQLNIEQRIQFMGARSDVLRFYLAADLLLHPAYFEAAGMVLLEALVAGLPILVTANCGYADFIEDAQAGLLISQPFQQAELNDKLSRALNQQQLQQWKANAMSYTKRTNLFSLAEKAADIIEMVGNNMARAIQPRELSNNPELC